jgi:type II secretory pathway component HofQ
VLVRTGDDAALRQISKLVADMDKPPKQVLLEMQILEVSLDNGFKSVFDIAYASGTPSSGLRPSSVEPTRRGRPRSARATSIPKPTPPSPGRSSAAS